MEWATIAAWVAAIATAIGTWVAWQQHQQQRTKEQQQSSLPTPLPNIESSPSPTAIPFPTTYNHPNSEFESEVDADYTKLRDLLAAKQYKEADIETAMVMLWVRCAEERGYLTNSDIRQFPRKDLRTLDRLWLKYSGGRFGFSVQRRIYELAGENLDQFYHYVGWKKKGQWVSYQNLTFDLRTPEGHLPNLGEYIGIESPYRIPENISNLSQLIPNTPSIIGNQFSILGSQLSRVRNLSAKVWKNLPSEIKKHAIQDVFWMTLLSRKDF